MAAIVEEKKAVILDTPSDWRKWLQNVKTVAQCGKADVWAMVDPSLSETEVQSPPEKPNQGTPGAIHPGALRPSDLTPEEYARWNSDRTWYKDQLMEYKEVTESLNKVITHIQATISGRNVIYTTDQRSAHARLRSLQSAIAPTSQMEKGRILQDYKALQSWNKKEKIESWVRRWESTYQEAKQVRLPEVLEERPLVDFLTALRAYNEAYASAALLFLRKQLAKGEIPSMESIIEEFRHEATRLAPLNRATDTHSAFATDQKGNTYKDSPSTSRARSPRPKPDCMCGSQHYYNECPYLNEELRPSNWKADSAIQKKVTEAMRDRGTKERVERSILRSKEFRSKQKETNVHATNYCAAHTTYHSAYSSHSTESSKHSKPLYRSWILDGASDIHVINHREGFTSEKAGKPGECLGGGKDSYPIEEFGTASVNLRTPSGGRVLTLLNVAYVPGFNTNIVSQDRLAKAGIHYSTERSDVLTRDRKVFAYLKKAGAFRTLEDNLAFEDPAPETHLAGATSSNSSRKSRSDKGGRKSAQPIQKTVTFDMVHKIMAHPSPEVVQHIEKAVKGLKIDKKSAEPPNSIDCVTCAVSKPTQLISRRSNSEEAIGTCPGESWSWDLIYETLAYNEDCFCSHFQDLHTGFNVVYTHSRLSDTYDIMVNAFNLIKNKYQYNPKHIQLDGERTLQKDWQHLLSELGIQERRTAPGSPQQSKAERAGRMLTIKARAMMIEANMPRNMWPEAYRTAAYIANRTPTKRLAWETPFKGFTKETPMMGHMHPFGCRAYAVEHNLPRKEKMLPRAQVGYLVGYDSTNIFRVWLPSKGKVIRTRDVHFDDTKLFHPSDIELGALQTAEVAEIIETMEIPAAVSEILQEFEREDQGYDSDTIVVDTSHVGLRNAKGKEKEQQESTHFEDHETPGIPETPESNSINIGIPTPISSRSALPSRLGTPTPFEVLTGYAEPAATPTIQEATGDPNQSKQAHTTEPETSQPEQRAELEIQVRPRQRLADLDEGNILPEGVTRSRRSKRREAMATMAGKTITTEDVSNQSYYSAFMASANTKITKIKASDLPPEPKTWRELKAHPKREEFLLACRNELRELDSKGTFKLVHSGTLEEEEIADVTLLPLMWVFKYKIDSDGYLTKYKSRLVARGDLQTTEEDTYAATAAIQTFRAMMAIAAGFDLEVKSYDVMNAYVNAELKEPIYCKLPPGNEMEGKALQLTRALYGLKHSPNLWYSDFVATLGRLGLYQIPGVNCLFSNEWLSLLFYVDDIVVIYPSKKASEFKRFEENFLREYEIRSLGNTENFLGIRLARDRTIRRLWLVLDASIEKMAKRFDVPLDARAPSTPLPLNFDAYSFDGKASQGSIYLYQQIIGSINYIAVNTRPDIARAASKLSQFLQNPSPGHIEAADHLLRYLVGTRTRAIQFDGLNTDVKTFCVASDASYGDNADRKSSYGYCFQLYGGPIQYKATKQRTVTTSSTEAELLAVSATVKELFFWKRFFHNIGLELKENISVYCDNIQTIRLLTSDDNQLITKLKHIDIHSHWLRQEIRKGIIKLEYQQSSLLVADGFTKELPRQKHEAFIQQLGLVDYIRPEPFSCQNNQTMP